MFNWLRRRRRRKILAQPFPDDWVSILHANLWLYARLPADRQRRLRKLLQVFVSEKNWEGCGGLKLTDEIRVTIAGQASLMLLERADINFDHVLSILVYPTAYVVPQTQIGQGGLVLESAQPRMGEAWLGGPVILSWQDCLAGARGLSGVNNLTVHEFAHQLDMLSDRLIDGTPPLETHQQSRQWAAVMQREYEQLQARCRRGYPGLLDCYGTTNPGEFFAVSSEAYFSAPVDLLVEHSSLYQTLDEFYQLGPAELVDPAQTD